MQRYFIKEWVDLSSADDLLMDEETSHHILKVMRMRVEDSLYLVDQSQRVFLAKLSKVDQEGAWVKAVTLLETDVELPVDVTIAVGLSKGDKLEWITQKATELGVFELIPLTLERNMVKWTTDKVSKKRERLQKIAKEAAEQAHRSKIPNISNLMTLQALLNQADQYQVCLVAYEESAKIGESSQLSSSLGSLKKGDKVLMVFGAEGGLSSSEVDLLTEYGVKPCSLGPRILRAETAPLYALAAISYQMELMKK